MFACEGYENELKLNFKNGTDYFENICAALEENEFFLKKLKTKNYKDIYYDTSNLMLEFADCCYRLRINNENKKLHVNFKNPIAYNKNGIICRKEIKMEFDKNDIADNVDIEKYLMEYDCKSNIYRDRVIEKNPLFLQFTVQTTREYFQIISKEVDLFGKYIAFGVACIDHSKVIYNDKIVDVLPQFEIEVWNNYIDIGVWDKINNISNLLQKKNFILQKESRYNQFSERV